MSEWITHDGRACPTADGVRVDIKTKGYETKGVRANLCEWGHGIEGCDDIIAYRLAQPEPAAPPGACKHGKAAYARCTECEDEFANPEPLARDMTKRERFAMEMLAGMLDAMCRCEVDDMNQRKYAQFAVEMADELLAALEAK